MHGGILAKYLAFGGPGPNPKTGRRDLGFPTSDEIRTRDGLHPLSRFQWGAIYWAYGGVCMYGDMMRLYPDGAELGGYGYPISDPAPLAGGEVVFCEYGCLWQGQASGGKAVGMTFKPPLLGHPALITGGQKLYNFVWAWKVPKDVRNAIRQNRPSLFTDLWKNRLVLQRVLPQGRPPEEPVLTETDAPRLDEGHNTVTEYRHYQVPALPDRALYNLAIRLPNGKLFATAPHSFYAKRSWDDFGFVHLTDLHVSRRLDGFYHTLLGADRDANPYVNSNDVFRTAIRYLNHLHGKGLIDLILAPGDIVDYGFEDSAPFSFKDGETYPSGGNFAFLRALILGRSAGPRQLPVEELRVPIFTTLGNHDYRLHPYALWFDIDVGDEGSWDWEPFQPSAAKDKQQYANKNLIQADAKALQGGRKLVLDEPSAGRGVAFDTRNQHGAYDYYFRRYAREASYVVELGHHRIVMLDTKFDIGIVEGEGFDYWNAVTGGFSEDENAFLGGSPNSAGFDEEQLLDLLKPAIQRAGADGLVVVCTHAPPFNPKNSEYPHYFRETEHAGAGAEIKGYLKRAAPVKLPSGQELPDVSGRHPEWINHGVAYFKRGSVADLLDDGIGKGLADTFLEICVGAHGERPVDLVLSGHIHVSAEFRLEWDAAKKMLYFMDFYTENPSEYYASKHAAFKDAYRVVVKAGAQLPARPSAIVPAVPAGTPPPPNPPPAAQETIVPVPPYPRPLNGAQNKRQWWLDHRPLVVQSAAAGLIENLQRPDPAKPGIGPMPTFHGFRVFVVRDNIIHTAKQIRMSSLPAPAAGLKWETKVPQPA